MSKEISRGLKLGRVFSMITVLLGAALITYMITVEGELGALPLFLIIVGIVWVVINRYKIRKQQQ